MKATGVRVALGIALAGALVTPPGLAEEGKALPTLLIKGEVVSLDVSDPAATLLKVKDRYGFETPVFLTGATAVTQEGAAVDASRLTTGTPVEVEYNFDVNTAKRHAVSVKVAAAAPTAGASPAAEAVPAPPAPAPVGPPAPEPASPSSASDAPAAPAEPAPSPGQEEPAPAP